MNFRSPFNALDFPLMLLPSDISLFDVDVDVRIRMVRAFDMDFDLGLFLK